jgi:drug/metabolite transporter (DMT)-like permease
VNATAIVLVLSGSVAHAWWNFLVARVPDGGRVFVWIYSALAFLLCLPLAGIVLIRSPDALSLTLLGGSVVSAALHLAYALSLQWGYSRSEMSVAYPVARGFAPVVVVVVAVAVLGERLSWLAVLGIAAVLGGIIIISAPRDSAGSGDRKHGSGVVAGLLIGVTIAGYTLWDDHSVNDLDLPAVPYYAGTVGCQLVLLTMATGKRHREAVTLARAHWRTALAVAVLTPTSYVLVLLALQIAPVSLVAPLRGTSIVIGSVLAGVLLKEPEMPRRLLGASIVLLGVVALALPA